MYVVETRGKTIFDTGVILKSWPCQQRLPKVVSRRINSSMPILPLKSDNYLERTKHGDKSSSRPVFSGKQILTGGMSDFDINS